MNRATLLLWRLAMFLLERLPHNTRWALLAGYAVTYGYVVVRPELEAQPSAGPAPEAQSAPPRAETWALVPKKRDRTRIT